MEPSQFATAHTTAQAGHASFHTWSVLHVSSPLDHVGSTYTCVVSHEASRTLLNGSCSLDTGGESHGPRAPSERPGHRAGSGGAAPEVPGSKDSAAPCRGPQGSGSPTAALLAPDTCPHAACWSRKGERCCPPPTTQAAISHQDVPATGHKAGACPGLGVRAATLNSCPLGASEAPQLPSPPAFEEPSQHPGGQVCPGLGAGLGLPEGSGSHTPTAAPDHRPPGGTQGQVPQRRGSRGPELSLPSEVSSPDTAACSPAPQDCGGHTGQGGGRTHGPAGVQAAQCGGWQGRCPMGPRGSGHWERKARLAQGPGPSLQA